MLKIKIDFDTLVGLAKLERFLLGSDDAEVEVFGATRLDHLISEDESEPYVVYQEDTSGMLIDVGYDFLGDTVYDSAEDFCEHHDWAELDENGDIVEKKGEEPIMKYSVQRDAVSENPIYTNNIKEAKKLAKEIALTHGYNQSDSYCSVYLTKELEEDLNTYPVLEYHWNFDTGLELKEYT